MTSPDIMWRIAKDCQLLWRRWDDEYIVYNTGSGHTHLLDSIGGSVLMCLEECPSDSQGLVSEMAGELKPDDALALTSRIEELLAKFQDLGLVESTQR